MDSKEETTSGALGGDGGRDQAESKGEKGCDPNFKAWVEKNIPPVQNGLAQEIYEAQQARQESLQSQGQAVGGIQQTAGGVPCGESTMPLPFNSGPQNEGTDLRSVDSPNNGNPSPERAGWADVAPQGLLAPDLQDRPQVDRREPGGSVQDGVTAARVELDRSDITTTEIKLAESKRRKKSRQDSAIKRVMRSGQLMTAAREIKYYAIANDTRFFIRLGKALETARKIKRKNPTRESICFSSK